MDIILKRKINASTVKNIGLRFFVDQALPFAPPEGAVQRHPGI